MKTVTTKTIFLLFLSFLLNSCVPPYTYKIKPNEKTATLQLFSIVGSPYSPRICKNDGNFILPNQESRSVFIVPAGRRVSINLPYEEGSYKCQSYFSFIPLEGRTYIASVYVKNRKCIPELIRKNTSAINGISLEKSFGVSQCKGQKKLIAK